MNELEKRLEERSRSLVIAESRQNFDEAIEYYMDNAVIQMPDAPLIRGKQDIKTTYEKIFSGVNLLEFSTTPDGFDFSASEDLAYEYGHGEMIVQDGDHKLVNHQKYMIIWKWMNNNWFVEGLSFSNNSHTPEIIN